MKGIAAFKKIAKKERAKGCRLQENSQEGESKVLPPLKEIICVCVCVCVCVWKETYFFSRETYTRFTIIDLLIVKLLVVCSVVFSLQRERVFHVNICVLVYDCYFGLLILLITLFGSQQMVSELRLELKPWPEKNARL